MSRSINESVNQLKTSLSDIKTSLSNKNIEGGEQLKVSEVAGLIDQIQAGGGEDSFAILCTPFKFLLTMEIDLHGFSEYKPTKTLSGYDKCSKIVFTDKTVPIDSNVVDVSLNEDNSVVAWIEENTLNVSTQKEGKKIGFIQATFNYGEEYDHVTYFSNNCSYNDRYGTLTVYSNIHTIDPKNLYPLTTDLSHLFDQCGNLEGSLDLSHWKIKPTNLADMFYSVGRLTEIDISGFDMSEILDGGQLANMFGGSNISKIYATEWKNQFKFENLNQMIFNYCTKLPNYSSSTNTLEYCSWQENGGCFTNPAEKGN